MEKLNPPSLDAPIRIRSDFLDRIEQHYGRLRRNAALADWRYLMGGSAESSLPWQLRLDRLFSIDGLLPWAQKSRQWATDATEARRFELLERLVTEGVIEQHPAVARTRKSLQGKIVAFRPLWKRQRVNRATIQEQLRTNPDREERRSAWYAQEPVQRSIEGRLRKLARSRNDRARAFGFRSYPDYRLRSEGFSVTRLYELMDEAARSVRTAARVQRARFEEASGVRDWFPWDRTYAEELETPVGDEAFRSKAMIPSVRRGVREWGFGSNVLRFPIDQHDIPMGGIQIPIDPPGDARVIVNPAADWTHYMILFHEVGHAVHARSNAVHSPFLRWFDCIPGYPGFLEGMGTLFEEIPRSAEWLATRPGIDEHNAEEFARVRRLSDLAVMASRIAQVQVELELYRNPDGDLEGTWYRSLRQLNVYDAFEPPSFAGPFLVFSPMYLQSYIFATLFEKQLLETMRGELGDRIWPNPRFGPWLTEHWFRPSGEFDWVPHLKALTGRPFGPAAFSRWARATLAAAEAG